MKLTWTQQDQIRRALCDADLIDLSDTFHAAMLQFDRLELENDAYRTILRREFT